jgi:exodeoxyribonuclease VII small subunit
MSAKRGTKGSDEAPASFDESLERREEVVGELEEGGLGLEESLDRYKEGVGLLKGCRERLTSFRAQVEELTAEGLMDHDGDPDASGAAGGQGPAGGQGAAAAGGTRAASDTRNDSTGSSGPVSLDGLDTPF